jgi:hypothetical protein
MTAHHAVIADRSDLAAVTLICPVCGAKIVINNLDHEFVAGTGNTRKLPEGCPCCSEHFDDSVREAIGGLMTFQRRALKLEQKAGKSMFQFEIRGGEIQFQP